MCCGVWWRDVACYEALCCVVWRGVACRDVAWRVVGWHGVVCVSRCDVVWRGVAWRGVLWCDDAPCVVRDSGGAKVADAWWDLCVMVSVWLGRALPGGCCLSPRSGGARGVERGRGARVC